MCKCNTLRCSNKSDAENCGEPQEEHGVSLEKRSSLLTILNETNEEIGTFEWSDDDELPGADTTMESGPDSDPESNNSSTTV